MFEDISIWGRIAFGICCLENYILEHEYPKVKWKVVFEQLWSFPEIEYYDEWCYKLVEYLPECIMEFNEYNSDSDWVTL